MNKVKRIIRITEQMNNLVWSDSKKQDDEPITPNESSKSKQYE